MPKSDELETLLASRPIEAVLACGAIDRMTVVQAQPDCDELIACVGCGAYWGHPDKSLDFPNRFKVDETCECNNPACTIEFYNPFTGETE